MKLIKVAAWLLVFPVILLLVSIRVEAASLTMQVTVGNSAPTLAGTSTNPVTSSASPINYGNVLQFLGTGTDPNSDNYYLLVCSTASVTTNNSGAPSCNGGVQYCVSSSTLSGAPANCNHTTNEAAQVSNWYATACDATAAQMCSAFSALSTFEVNHAPTYTSAATGSAANPGALVTFTVAAGNWGDADSSGTADQGKVVICGAAGITAGVCNSLPICASASLTTVGLPLTCTYTVPTPTSSGAKTVYGYVIDTHNMGASGAVQGTALTYTVNNVVPTISSVAFKSDAVILTNILPVAGTTTTKAILLTVSDSNGCANIDANTVVSGKTYHLGGTFTNASCTSTNESCITGGAITCTRDGIDTCTGGSDVTVSFTCTATIQYYNDPTDVSSKWAADNWEYSGIATDLSLGASAAATTTTEMMLLNAHTPSAGAVNYGAVTPNNNTPTNFAATITNAGNIGLDSTLNATLGNGYAMCTDYPTCAGGAQGRMLAAQQAYSTTSGTPFASATALTGAAVPLTLGILKPTLASSTPQKSIYWGIAIPGSQIFGTYTGTNIVATTMSPVGTW